MSARAWLPQPVVAPPVVGSVDARGRVVIALTTDDAIWGLVTVREPAASSLAGLLPLAMIFAVVGIVARVMN